MARLSSHRMLCLSLFELLLVGDGDKDRGMRRCEINLPAWGEGPGPVRGVQGSRRCLHVPGQSSPLLPHLVPRGLEEGGWRMENEGWRVEDRGWSVDEGGWKMKDGEWRTEDGRWKVEDGGRPWEDREAGVWLLLPLWEPCLNMCRCRQGRNGVNLRGGLQVSSPTASPHPLHAMHRIHVA